MYKQYFGLAESPFSIAPDPRYLYMSDQHREALAHLMYGINSDGGFVLLTGEIGTGKTTVCRCFLDQIPEGCDIAFILNPKLTARELLSTICDEFRIRYPQGNKSVKVFIDLINAYLLDAHAKGRKAILVIDEAQNLRTDVLELTRLLTNLETSQRKLLQIILLGQPELRNVLSRPELRQLSQRIVARYHLGPLTKEETAAYISHRLAVAGLRNEVFPASIMRRIFRLTRGIPRLINIVCDRALLGAYVQEKDTVDRSTLKRAAREVFGGSSAQERWPLESPRQKLWISLGLVSAALILMTAYVRYRPWPTLAVFRSIAQQEKTSAEAHRRPIRESSPSTSIGKAPGEGAHREHRIESGRDDLSLIELQRLAAFGSASEKARAKEASQERPSSSAQSLPDDSTGSRSAPTETTPEEVREVKHGQDEQSDSPEPQGQRAAFDPLEWPPGESIHDSKALAIKALFAEWGYEYDTRSGLACTQAVSRGMRCLFDRGGLDDLRQINRPAVLTLLDEQGRRFYATLKELESHAAIFVVGSRTRRIALQDMALKWNGEYFLLWRSPPNHQSIIQQGQSSPAVEWLDTRLAGIHGRPPRPPEKAVFDVAMVEEVKRFQLANGLRPDGIVGPQTIIRLNTTTMADGLPLLIKDDEDD